MNDGVFLWSSAQTVVGEENVGDIANQINCML